MSFNDLERGATSSPPPPTQSASTGLNGQQYGRGSGRSGRGGARGPLPLYHAPRSSSPGSSVGLNEGTGTGPATSDPDFKKLADRIGIQIFKLNSNVQGIDKLVELQLRKMRTTKSQTESQKADKDWTAQM